MKSLLLLAFAAPLVACAPAIGGGESHADEKSEELATNRPALRRRLTFEAATIAPDMTLRDDGITYARVLDGTPLAPAIVTDPQAFEGQHALRYEVPAGTDHKERLEHKLSTFNEPDALGFANVRYTGFAFQLGATAVPMESSALFFQEWQGFPYGPPVALKLTKSSGPDFIVRLAVRNMDTGPDSATPDLVVWSGTLSAGQWHRFVIGVRPNHAQPLGFVKLWFDGALVADWSGKIGYDPASVRGAQTGFDTKFGLYQPSANAGHTVYFDDVRFATTFAAASP